MACAACRAFQTSRPYRRAVRRSVETTVSEPVSHGFLAFCLLDRRSHARLLFAQHASRAASTARVASRSVKMFRVPAPPFGYLPAVREQRGAAFDGGGRVVQLVSESSGQLSERNHLLVVQVARGEGPGAIDHGVNQDSRDFVHCSISSRNRSPCTSRISEGSCATASPGGLPRANTAANPSRRLHAIP